LSHATKSHHHQGVDRLGDGLIVSGVSTLDDLPEAIERPGRRFVLGVQWHPEADPQSTVIGAFVDSTRRSLAPAGTAVEMSHAADPTADGAPGVPAPDGSPERV
jgi:GMP synthase-like glutamine amidotransferase